jgi:O-antigen/teichoic acid export membrane protein
MGRARRILLNTLWLLFSQVLTTLAALWVTGYVASELGETGFGELNGADAFVMLFSPIVFAGIQVILIRDIVKANNSSELSAAEKLDIARRALGDAIVVRLLIAPVFIGLVWVLAPALIPQIRHVLIWLALLNWFLNMYQQTFTIPMEASERMHFLAVGSLIAQFVGMALSVVAVVFIMGPEGVLGARSAGMASSFFYLISVISLAVYRPKFDVDFKRYWRLIRQGFPLAIYYLMGLVLLELDKTMLTYMASLTEDDLLVRWLPWVRSGEESGLGLDDVGLYSSATILAYKFEAVVIAFQTAVVPALVATWKEGKDAYEKLLGRSLRFVIVLGVPIAVGTDFIARDIMGLIYEDQYLVASRALAIIIWFVPFQFLNRVLASSLAATEREKWIPISVALAVITNALLNLVLIPLWGYEGSGVATVISEALLVGMYLVIQRSHLVGLVRQLKLVRVTLVTGVLVGLCWVLQGQHFLVIIAAAVVVYGAAVLGLKCIDREELRAILRR